MADNTTEVAKLFTKRSQINALDTNFRSAFHYACVLGKPEMAVLLLDEGANHRCKDANGAMGLHYAVQVGSLATVEAVIRRPEVTHEGLRTFHPM